MMHRHTCRVHGMRVDPGVCFMLGWLARCLLSSATHRGVLSGVHPSPTTGGAALQRLCPCPAHLLPRPLPGRLRLWHAALAPAPLLQRRLV